MTSHKEITRLLRGGGTLKLNVARKRARILFENAAFLEVDWTQAQTYVQRLRNGSQPDLSKKVQVQYPSRTATIFEEGKQENSSNL